MTKAMRYLRDERGNAAIEYCLFAALIGVVLSAVYAGFVENGLGAAWEGIVTALSTAGEDAPPAS